MNISALRLKAVIGWVFAASALAGCGSGSEDTGPVPVASIVSPAQGATFKGGDTLAFSGSATDAQGAAIATSNLTWWADLHHDEHTHPLQQTTAGGTGSVTIPVRGETSSNIFYRFHFKATDAAGRSSEVTRDVLPLKAQITLATSPAGLQLTLGGQPVTAPLTVTGVVGIERDLGAPDQDFNGRHYQFVSWSDGGAATHTISTPVADATYTATFTEVGAAANVPPSVSLSAPANATVGTPVTLTATAADSDGSLTQVQFFNGSTLIGTVAASPYTLAWTPTAAGTATLTARATDDQGAVTASNAASVAVAVAVAGGGDTQPPTAALTAPADLATGLAGTITLAATAADNVGVAGVEFQVDGVIVGTEITTAPYQTSLDISAYPSGQHVVRARARDAAGNVSAWSTSTVRVGGSRTVPPGFTKDEAWITGLNSAVAFAQAPDGRLFVAEQGGSLQVVKNNAAVATPFVQLTVDSSGERGLLGVAFHPNFASNGWVYVYYTDPSGPHNRISRFVADPSNGDVSTGSETVLVDLPALVAPNHNGGAMHFGLDGKLYVGVGENAVESRSQDLSSPFGKLLRFNDDGSIPADNPNYATQTGLARAVWASGLRNPFTFAIQPGTGRIHINDVGQNTWEEINLGAPGANYGWPGSEGGERITSGITAPLFTYKHSAACPAGSGPGGFFTGFSIAGGAFYPGTGNFPAAYQGSYFFGDYVSRFVGRIDLASGNANAAYAFASVADSPVDMLVGKDGALYVLTRSGISRISAP
jgi:glucose/arabinose dehydrogenase